MQVIPISRFDYTIKDYWKNNQLNSSFKENIPTNDASKDESVPMSVVEFLDAVEEPLKGKFLSKKNASKKGIIEFSSLYKRILFSPMMTGRISNSNLRKSKES